MYFPTLNILKNYHQIDNFVISKLDSWLGTRRQAVRKFLTPLQFSIDTDIDEEYSISLFAICTDPKIKVLQEKYIVECPHDNTILGVYTSAHEVPHRILCNECNQYIDVSLNNLVIWFELIQSPQLPQQNGKKDISRGNDIRGKAGGLRPARIKKTPTARRLLDGLDERIRSS
ncbi:hypothetical protein FZC78_02790 [Rossellomorea vietnamensis]|uniref:Uncharacterized protein n=1 Tax=Rossellomorea vietnamensis TaxID=218284 RepID=A0A5D4NVW3_9BACI|nr:hypothetical protein [Rossellomorea vietnamensis]TYS18483.1 hypothetical protein FZC78_02790 [Rossellomorea vietnamensis]